MVVCLPITTIEEFRLALERGMESAVADVSFDPCLSVAVV